MGHYRWTESLYLRDLSFRTSEAGGSQIRPQCKAPQSNRQAVHGSSGLALGRGLYRAEIRKRLSLGAQAGSQKPSYAHQLHRLLNSAATRVSMGKYPQTEAPENKGLRRSSLLYFLGIWQPAEKQKPVPFNPPGGPKAAPLPAAIPLKTYRIDTQRSSMLWMLCRLK